MTGGVQSTNAIAVNARYRCHLGDHQTGVHRYAAQIERRISSHLELFTPRRMQLGVKGHMWEQFVLPALVGKRLLWSPSGTGPVAVSRQVSTIHDAIIHDRPEWFNPTYAQWVKWSVSALAQRAMHIITVSSFSKERIIATMGVDEAKVTVVLEGVDQDYRPGAAEEVEEAQAATGIPLDQRYVLYVGNIEPRKNLDGLLQAWDMALPEMPEDVSLVVAGARGLSRIFGGVAFDRLPERVHLIGYVPEHLLPALYSGALAFVYPSLYEGFGLPVLEAMACGTPVVASAASSLPEVVDNAGRLVDPHDAEDIADGLLSVVSKDDLRQELVRAGFQRAQALTWDRAATETLAVLQKFA